MGRVKVTCVYNNKKWTLEFEESMSTSDVMEYMEQRRYIPNGLYVRHNKNCSPWLPHIFEGAELLFCDPSTDKFNASGAILYGCPKSRDIIGEIPDCMLINFNGYSVEEV